jgi:chromosome segregation ATPase
MSLSDKRAALAQHLSKVAAQSAAYQAAAAPVEEIMQRLEPALSDLAAAESHYSSCLRIEADAIVACGDVSAASAAVTAAAADLDQKRRVVAALQTERSAREQLLADVSLSMNVTGSATDPLVCQVVEAIGEDVYSQLLAAGEAFTAAQAAARTLAAHFLEKKWLAAAERLNTKLNTAKIPAWQSQAHPDWRKLTEELTRNADAIPGV